MLLCYFVRVDEDVDCGGDTQQEVGQLDQQFPPQRLVPQRPVHHHLETRGHIINEDWKRMKEVFNMLSKISPPINTVWTWTFRNVCNG